MNIEKVNKEYYDRLYGRKASLLQLIHPLISFDQQSKSKRNIRAILPTLALTIDPAKQGPRVLDYGFGHGSFLLKLPDYCDIYGCDLSHEAVLSLQAVARSREKRMTLFTSDRFQEETQSVEFDLIVCSHVLEHVPDDGDLVRKFAERLAPGGKILINIPINEVWEDPKHVRAYTQESIRRLLELAALKTERIWLCDRWTAYLLIHEQVKPSGRLGRVVLKLMRLLFAITPLRLLDVFERILPKKYREQQLLVLAGRG